MGREGEPLIKRKERETGNVVLFPWSTGGGGDEKRKRTFTHTNDFSERCHATRYYEADCRLRAEVVIFGEGGGSGIGGRGAGA